MCCCTDLPRLYTNRFIPWSFFRKKWKVCKCFAACLSTENFHMNSYAFFIAPFSIAKSKWYILQMYQRSAMNSVCASHKHSWRFESTRCIIGPYKPSVSTIDSVFHNTYVVCVNYIHEWRDRDLQFKVERQILQETFSDFLPEICWEEIAQSYFCILFWCLAWTSNPGIKSNKSTHYLGN